MEALQQTILQLKAVQKSEILFLYIQGFLANWVAEKGRFIQWKFLIFEAYRCSVMKKAKLSIIRSVNVFNEEENHRSKVDKVYDDIA
jgi:hypothetical protein